MPGLTVTEKEFWKQRIAARIEKRVEAIRARHPALLERVKRDARAEALRSLRLDEPHAELEAIQAEKTALARRRNRVQRAMLAALRGLPLDEVCDGFSLMYGIELPLPVEVHGAIAKRQAAHQEQLLGADVVGREIARLEAERERLLDVVWLASSPAQIKQLWSKVAGLLGDEPTELEREALAIEPAGEKEA
jgi:hypothetical protein